MQAGWLREAVALCRERVETFDLAALSCEEISDPRVLAVQPLVSVVMITYNHAAYILQAVEGVLGQKTRFPFELIIAEDCSSDATRQIVLDVQRRHPDLVRVLVSGSNVGASVNMARAEQRCRGTYIA